MAAPERLALSSRTYQPTWCANFFHSFPHFSLLPPFEAVNATFSWQDRAYAESLLVLLLAVAVWLSLWLIIYAIYFVASCCPSCNRHEKQRRTRSLRWTLAAVALAATGAVAVALYGNEEFNEGLSRAQVALGRLDSSMHIMSTREMAAAETVLRDTRAMVGRLQQAAGQESNAATLLPYIERADLRLQNAHALHTELSAQFIAGVAVNGSAGPPDVGAYNQYRWIGTLLIAAWLLLLCAFVWIASGCKSRWALLVVVVLLVISLVLVWGSAAVYLALTVGAADLCMDPKVILKGNSDVLRPDADLFTYYITCEGSNPVYRSLIAVHEKLSEAGQELESLSREANSNSVAFQQQSLEVKGNITGSQHRLMELNRQLDCRPTAGAYQELATGLCKVGLTGLAYMLLGFTVAGTLMIVAVFLAHVAARHVGTKKAYFQVDVQDSVVVREQPRTEQPLHYRFSQASTLEAESSGRGSNAAVGNAAAARSGSAANRNSTAAAGATADGGATGDQRPGLRHTPPPAYNIEGNFFSSYGTGTSQGTLDSRHGATEPLNANRNTFQ